MQVGLLHGHYSSCSFTWLTTLIRLTVLLVAIPACPQLAIVFRYTEPRYCACPIGICIICDKGVWYSTTNLASAADLLDLTKILIVHKL